LVDIFSAISIVLHRYYYRLLKADNKNLIIEGINATGFAIFYLSGPAEKDSGVVYIIYK